MTEGTVEYIGVNDDDPGLLKSRIDAVEVYINLRIEYLELRLEYLRRINGNMARRVDLEATRNDLNRVLRMLRGESVVDFPGDYDQ